MNLEADRPGPGELSIRNRLGMPCGHPEHLTRNLPAEDEQYLDGLDYALFRGAVTRWPNGDRTRSHAKGDHPVCGESWQGSRSCSSCWANHAGGSSNCNCDCHRFSSRAGRRLALLALGLRLGTREEQK